MAAVLWRYSVRSFAMASRMKAIAMVNSSASKLSTVSHTLPTISLAGRPRQHREQRRAQQEQRAVREQHEDRRPARNQGLAAPAPELVGGEPRVGRDDAGGEQEAQVEIASRSSADARRSAKPPGRPPDTSAAADARRTPARRSRSRAKLRNSSALARSIEIASDTEPYMPNSTTEPARSRCGRSPPGDRANLRILDPREQQQQAENGFDVDGDQEKRVDVEVHRAAAEQKCVRGHAADDFHRRHLTVTAAKNAVNTGGTAVPKPGLWFRQSFAISAHFEQMPGRDPGRFARPPGHMDPPPGACRGGGRSITVRPLLTHRTGQCRSATELSEPSAIRR